MTLKNSLVAPLLLSAFVGSVSAEDWKLGVSMVSNPGGGIQVLNVFPGSPAERIGLQAGSLIVTVDGYLASDPYALRDYIFDGRTGVVVTFQNSMGGFTEAQADFQVVMADPPVAAIAAPGAVTAYGAGSVKGIVNARKAYTLKINKVTKRSVTDPRHKGKLNVLKTNGKPTAKPKPVNQPVSRPPFKSNSNPFLKR